MSLLTPFVDAGGILRLGGRLRNTELDPEEKHPAIIPRHSTLSTLIIKEDHQRSFHGGTQLTLAHIRQKGWIIGGRAPVRSHIIKCVICARHRTIRAEQLMGQLPSRRVTPSRAFLHSGVDFAGPILLLRWRGAGAKTYKAYIAVFVCLATSAIHLEIVTDLSTEGFIAAYKRFTGRRGISQTITSDRGRNFLGAQREIRQLFDEASRESADIAAQLASSGTEWKLIPPHSPHMGGKWEAAVKSVKYHIQRTIGKVTLTYEDLTTLLCQIKDIIKSRPLCPLTNDPADISALSPGHFIIGEALTTLPEPSLREISQTRLGRWQIITRQTQYFWDRWAKTCLHRYQAIYKSKNPTNQIKIGSLVVIVDERVTPTKWPLARVIRLHPGRDELTRGADLQTATQITSRAINRLVPLPINRNLLENPPGEASPRRASGRPSDSGSSSGEDDGGRDVENVA